MDSVIEMIDKRIAMYDKKIKKTQDFTKKETAAILLKDPNYPPEKLATKIMKMKDIINLLEFAKMELEWLKEQLSEG